MLKTRRTQAERSAATREKLLTATIDLLVTHGSARLSTAMVDTRAGVSSGARAHHFPTKVDLLVAATAQTYDTMLELGRQRARFASRSTEPLREYVKDCTSIYFDWPFIAALEVVITARTDEAVMERLKPVLDGFHRAMRETWVEALTRAGYEPTQAEEDIMLTLNLIRGMAVNRMWRNDAKTYEALLDSWCRQRRRPKASATGQGKRSDHT